MFFMPNFRKKISEIVKNSHVCRTGFVNAFGVFLTGS